MLTSIEMEYPSLCDPGVVMSSLSTLGKPREDSASSEFLTQQLTLSPSTSSTTTRFASIECYENWFERLSRIVSTEIVLAPSIKQAAKVTHYWLETFIACKLYGNFNSAVAVALGIQQQSVQRLHKRMGMFTAKTENLPPTSCQLTCHQKFFREARAFVEPMQNFHYYRNEYARYRKANPELITIPWFVLLRKDLLLLKQHTKTSLEKAKDAAVFQTISMPIMEYTVLQASVFDFIMDETLQAGRCDLGAKNVELERALTLNGGVLDQNRLMYHSYLLESARGSYEKVE